MKYILSIFIILSLLLANHSAINSWIATEPQSKCQSIQDENITSIIKNQTNISSPVSIRLCNTDAYFGQMTGLPNKPIMYISTTAQEKLNPLGTEWLILHEAAHHQLWHIYKWGVVQLLCIVSGAFVLVKLYRYRAKYAVLALPLLIVTVGYTSTQFERLQEIQANQFAIEHISDVQGVITGAQVSMEYYNSEETSAFEAFIRKNFYVWDKPAKIYQIEQAQVYMNKN